MGEVDVGNDEKNNSDAPNTIAVSTLMTDMKSNQTQSMEQELEILDAEDDVLEAAEKQQMSFSDDVTAPVEDIASDDEILAAENELDLDEEQV